MEKKEKHNNFFQGSLFMTPIDQKFTDDQPQSYLNNLTNPHWSSENRVQFVNKHFGLYYSEVGSKNANKKHSNINKITVNGFLRDNWELRAKINNETQRLYYSYIALCILESQRNNKVD